MCVCVITVVSSPPSPRGAASPAMKQGQPASSNPQRAAPGAPSRPAPSVPSRAMGPSPTPVGNLPAPLIPT